MNIIKRILRFILSPFHRLDKKLFSENDEQLSRLSEKIDQLQKDNEIVSQNVRNLNSMLNGYDKVIQNIRNLNSTSEQLTSDYDRLHFLMNQLQKNHVNVNTSERIAVSNSDATLEEFSNRDNYSVIDYFDFENYFRGSRELIKKRQAEYLVYLKDCSKVLDIGCGRGEFLEIMKENSISAEGVDTYEPFVDYCNEKGFKAVCKDGIEYLSEESGFDGVFAGQVIEHLNISQIVSLIEIAYEKLPDGGILIMETPNPCSLSVYVNAFYLDPSHIKPVHPETMRYLLKNAGYRNVDIVFTENSRPDIVIPPIKGEDEFNLAMNKVQDMLFSSQDYAVIARK